MSWMLPSKICVWLDFVPSSSGKMQELCFVATVGVDLGRRLEEVRKQRCTAVACGSEDGVGRHAVCRERGIMADDLN